MELVERYYCKYCKGYFKTPDRHKCKKDPANKTCWTCEHLAWDEIDPNEDYGYKLFCGLDYPPYHVKVQAPKVRNCDKWEKRRDKYPYDSIYEHNQKHREEVK